MGFSRAELASFTGQTLPDLLPARLRLLIVGINPGLLTVAVQAHSRDGATASTGRCSSRE